VALLTFLNVSHYRLTKVRTSRDKLFWDLDGRYFYYKHGPLARLEVGQDHVQGQDYLHSIHGWIKGVNMPTDLVGLVEPGLDGDVTAGANLNKWAGRDVFAYHLGYYDGDYEPIGSVGLAGAGSIWTDMASHVLSLPSQGTGLYNGNIAVMATDMEARSATWDPEANAYAYQYDQLNRIKHARSYYWDAAGEEFTRTGVNGEAGYYDEDFWYDRNGNLDSLTRKQPFVDLPTGQYGQFFDKFKYRYTLDGNGNKVSNRLAHVNDAAASGYSATDIDDEGTYTMGTDSNYHYDKIGNLIADEAEHIDEIKWDLQGKVRAVIRTTAGRTLGLPDLYFWYDGMGRRIHKQVLQPVEDADPDTTDTWYAMDPQGNVMSVYEQTRASGWKHTRVREFPIYGADRLGMVTANLLLRSELMSLGPVFDPSWTYRALVVGEVMYDSPKEKDPADPVTELNEGEYVVLVNNTDRRLPLSYFSLVELLSGDTVVLDSADTLEPQQRMVLAFTDSLELFGRLAMLPEVMRDDTKFSLLRSQMDMGLPDKGGIVAVLYQEPGGDTLEVDRVAYGEYFGLLAENDEVVDSLIDSLEMRDGLMSVLRTGYSMDPVAVGGGPVWHGGGVVGQSDPAVEPLPLPFPGIGSYLLSRGGNRYELKNHLGNVLAVVSDLKLGRETGAPDWVAEYYEGDVVRMQDYDPFGVEMDGRGYVSEEYRYGFQGQEKDNEIKGSGNSLNYEYRMADTRLGRFFAVDPLAPKYPGNSVYAFSENRVIDGVELEGLEYQPVNASGNNVAIGSPQISDYKWVGYETNYEWNKGANPEDGDMPTAGSIGKPLPGTVPSATIFKAGKCPNITFYGSEGQKPSSISVELQDAGGLLPRQNTDLHNLQIGEFAEMAATLYGEAGFINPMPTEAAGIYDVMENRSRIDGRTPLQLMGAGGIYGHSGTDYNAALANPAGTADNRLNSARVGLVLGLVSSNDVLDYSDGAYFWDGAVYLNNPATYPNNFFNKEGHGTFVGTSSNLITFSHVKQIGATIFMKYNQGLYPNKTWP
jgi:RHS repeat-associated protein